jgi:spermidine/putrescine-binding protein
VDPIFLLAQSFLHDKYANSDYIDPEFFQEFEETFHTRVKKIYYETKKAVNELLLEGNGKGYDLLVVSGLSIAHYIRRNWVVPPEYFDACLHGRGPAV